MELELGCDRGEREIIRSAALCERRAGTRLFQCWRDLGPADGALVLERGARVEAWASWVRVESPVDEVQQPLQATPPTVTRSATGNTLIIDELVVHDGAASNPLKLARAIAPRLAIELGISWVLAATRLELDSSRAGSVHHRLMQSTWGEAEEEPQTGLALGLAMGALPISFRMVGDHTEAVLIWRNPLGA